MPTKAADFIEVAGVSAVFFADSFLIKRNLAGPVTWIVG